MQLFFRLGSWMLIVTAALHLVGHFAASPPPANDTEAELRRLLESYEWEHGIFERSTKDFLDGYSLSFATILFFVGATNLVMMRVHRGRIKGLQVLSLANLLLSLSLLLLSWSYFVLPPVACFGVCLLLFSLAWVSGLYEGGWHGPSKANLTP